MRAGLQLRGSKASKNETVYEHRPRGGKAARSMQKGRRESETVNDPEETPGGKTEGDDPYVEITTTDPEDGRGAWSEGGLISKRGG